MGDFTPNLRTPLTPITGSRGPEQQPTVQVVPDVSDEITSYMPSAYPLTVLTRRVKDETRVTHNFRFDWIEGDEYPRDIVITGDVTPAGTDISVTAGDDARVAAGWLLMNVRTRELVRVSSTSSGHVLVAGTGGRDSGGTGAKSMVTGDTLVYVAPAAEDGADVGTSKTVMDVPQYNYTQIIRTVYKLTRRDMQTELFGGRDLAKTRKKQGIEHAKSIEQMLFFGQRNYFAGTDHLVTLSGGLEYFVRSNIWDLTATGSLEERSFDDFLAETMRWGDGGNQKGAGVKYLLSSSRVISRINWFAKDQLQYRPLDETIGFGAMEYKSPHGRVMLIHAPILDYNHQGWAFLLDMNHITYAYLRGGDTSLLRGRGGNGVDGETEEYLSDVGLELKLEAAHAIIKGVA